MKESPQLHAAAIPLAGNFALQRESPVPDLAGAGLGKIHQ